MSAQPKAIKERMRQMPRRNLPKIKVIKKQLKDTHNKQRKIRGSINRYTALVSKHLNLEARDRCLGLNCTRKMA